MQTLQNVAVVSHYARSKVSVWAYAYNLTSWFTAAELLIMMNHLKYTYSTNTELNAT